ncbi:MAG: hypothetical protein DSY55_05255 [Clostridia bacterium]|nr:MAG: hypothetical protein DSY55_05255 [Clostridia bacterium]
MSEASIAAIILAAGASTRFGAPKQLLDWYGQPLLRQIALQTLATPARQIVVVLGAYFQQAAPVMHGLPVTLAYNPRWQRGMSSSVALGLRALRGQADAALFLLADQPNVSSDLMTRVMRTYASTRAPIVAPRHRGQRGNPALFARELFPDLMQVTGDQGGRALFRRYADQVHWLEADASILFDIDRPQDMPAHQE